MGDEPTEKPFEREKALRTELENRLAGNSPMPMPDMPNHLEDISKKLTKLNELLAIIISQLEER